MQIIYKSMVEKIDEVIERAKEEDREIKEIILNGQEMAQLERELEPFKANGWVENDFGYSYNDIAIKEN